MLPEPGTKNSNEIHVVAPTGFELVSQSRSRFREQYHMVLGHMPRRNATRLKHARQSPETFLSQHPVLILSEPAPLVQSWKFIELTMISSRCCHPGEKRT
jgi:hypothetical protein